MCSILKKIVLLSLLFISLCFTHTQSVAQEQSSTTFKFQLDTTPALPEFSVQPLQYRLGVANALGREFLVYFGDRLYFLEWTFPSVHETSTLKIGFVGGVYLGMFFTLKSYQAVLDFSLDTLDGYFSLVSEWDVDSFWGIGIEINHLSAHFGDGRFKNRRQSLLSENYFSFRFVLHPSSKLDVQLKPKIFFTSSLGTPMLIELMAQWRPISTLQIEGYAEVSPSEFSIRSIRAKLSYWIGENQSRAFLTAVPFLLFHTGRHFYGQRHSETVSFQALAGLEVVI